MAATATKKKSRSKKVSKKAKTSKKTTKKAASKKTTTKKTAKKGTAKKDADPETESQIDKLRKELGSKEFKRVQRFSDLEDETPEAIRDRVKELSHTNDQLQSEMAQTLFKVWVNDLWRDWGYASFKDYVVGDAESFGRKAMYLVQVWKELVVQRNQEPKLLDQIGWSKAIGLVNLDKADPEKFSEHLAYVKKKSTSVRAIRDLVKELKSGSGDGGSNNHLTKRLSIPLTEEQHEHIQKTIEKIKAANDVKTDGHALDMLCLEYNSSIGKQGVMENVSETLEAIRRSTGSYYVGFPSHEAAETARHLYFENEDAEFETDTAEFDEDVEDEVEDEEGSDDEEFEDDEDDMEEVLNDEDEDEEDDLTGSW